MAFVNAHTAPDDFVVVPKQIWLVRNEAQAMLAFCVNYEARSTIWLPSSSCTTSSGSTVAGRTRSTR